MESRQYEEFQPELNWIEDATSHTLVVNVGGFTREQLRLQRDPSAKNLKINGERRLVGNRWSRIKVGVPIPEKSDVQAVRARYENGTLYVVVPKLQSSNPKQPQPISPLPSTKTLPKKPEPIPKLPLAEKPTRSPKAEVQGMVTTPKEEAKPQHVGAGQVKPTATKPKEEPRWKTLAKPKEDEKRAKEAQTFKKEEPAALATKISQTNEESTPNAKPGKPTTILKPPEALATKVSQTNEKSAPNAKPKKPTTVSRTHEADQSDSKLSAEVEKTTPKEMKPTFGHGLVKDGKQKHPLQLKANGKGQAKRAKEAATMFKDEEKQLIINVVISSMLVVGFGTYIINKIWNGLLEC